MDGGLGPAPGEDTDLVTPLQGVVKLVGPQEAGPTQDENPKGLGSLLSELHRSAGFQRSQRVCCEGTGGPKGQGSPGNQGSPDEIATGWGHDVLLGNFLWCDRGGDR